MIKKSGFIICILIIFSLYVSAQTDTNPGAAAGLGDVDKLTKPITSLINEEDRTQFLMGEWGKLLDNTWVGPILTKTSNLFTFFNPFLNMVLGVSFLLSWYFFLTLFAWLLLIAMSFNFFYIIEIYINSIRNAKLARWGASLAFFILISSVRIPRFISLTIISAISAAKYWTFQLVLVIIVFFAFIFLFLYSGIMKKHFKKLRTLKDIKLNKKEIEEEKKESRAFRKGTIRNMGTNEKEDEEARSEIRGMADEV